MDHPTHPSLAEFLLARIAEDEREIGFVHNDECDHRQPPGFPCDCLVPERTRLRCTADRRIVELHHPSAEYDHLACVLCQWDVDCDGPKHDYQYNDGETAEFPCDTLRALASVYADHPDYRQEWTP